MNFRDDQIIPNAVIPWHAIRVGSVSDARWRDVPPMAFKSVLQVVGRDVITDYVVGS